MNVVKMYRPDVGGKVEQKLWSRVADRSSSKKLT